MFKVFGVAHSHRHGSDIVFVLCEDEPDAIDLAIHDPDLYEIQRHDENVIITELQYNISQHLDQSGLSHAANRDAALFNVVKLATTEDRNAYIDKYDAGYDVTSRYYRRD